MLTSKEGLSNPFKLPRGERLRRAVAAVFRDQRAAVLRYLNTGRKDQAGGLPFHWPHWHDFGLGALDLSKRFTPLLTLTWDAAAAKFAPRVGLDPNSWDVVNPHTARTIDEAALAFSDSMNETTSLQLDAALAKTREELHAGIIDHGEALPAITKRIAAIFDGAETYRARRIAWTETSRAVHSAQEAAAVASGVVTGWLWLISSDACPICVAIAARAPAVRLGHAFAVIGENPHYSQVKFPPAHPHCNCAMEEVLDTDEQPAWSDTLHQPDPATDEEIDRVAATVEERDNRTLGGKPKPKRPAPAKRPRPAPAKPRRPKPEPEPGLPDARPAWTVPAFAARAIAAAREAPRFRDTEKVWITDAFTEFRKVDPDMTREHYADWLVRANQERLVTLSRNDMPQRLSVEELTKERASEVRQANATFHWIKLPAPELKRRYTRDSDGQFAATGASGAPGETAGPKRTGKEEQRYGEAQEAGLVKKLGGVQSGDNLAMDVTRKIGGAEHGIEVKTIVNQGGDYSGTKAQLSMKREQVERKLAWRGEKAGREIHTVCFDHRHLFGGGAHKADYSGHDIYYKRGVGKLRIGGMHKVKSIKELKELMSMPYDDLPAAARGKVR